MADKLVTPVTLRVLKNGVLLRAETLVQPVIKLGRDAKAHLRLDDPQVARMHAVLEAREDAVELIDLGSGTMVNGVTVSRATLRSGDQLRLGATELEVVLEAPRNPGARASALPITPAMLPVASTQVTAPMAAVAGLDGEELYQLIKRGDIVPSEVEEVGGQAVEVSVLWKTSILHVAHLEAEEDFALTGQPTAASPTKTLLGASWAVGGVGMVLGAAYADPHHLERSAGLVLGGLGALTSLGGSLAGAVIDRKQQLKAERCASFVVGPELLGGAARVPVVTRHGRFVFLPGATGEVELQGARRSLEELKAQGHARPSTVVDGGFEVTIQPEGRYRQEVGGLTLVAKVVAPGRAVATAPRRDSRLWGAVGGALLAMSAAVGTLHLAGADAGLLSQGTEDERLEQLRAFVDREVAREQERPEPRADDREAGGTGQQHAGPEGALGSRTAPRRSARYAIQNHGEPPHLARETARAQVEGRGIFRALASASGAMGGGTSGIVAPFGGITESGLDDRNANGNMTGDVLGDAYGYGGLGSAGTGWGGGGDGTGGIGMGRLGTLGHGSGLGPGQSYGHGVGQGLRDRGTTGWTLRRGTPTVTGLLSPDAIRRVVLRNIGQVNHCYEQGLAQSPTAAGRVAVRFVIGGDGNVLGSSVSDNSLPLPSVGQCVANAVRRWQFPPPEGNGVVNVNYPFSFQPANP